MTGHHAPYAWLPDGVHADVRLEVVDGTFTAITTGTAPQPGDERLDGLVLPGLANGHSHAFHRALRGRTHGGGTFWTWREQMYAVATRLDPDTYRALALAVFAEMALAGYTCVGEFHYLHHDPQGRPYADPNAMGAALVDAAEQAGLRLTLLDTLYLAGGLTAAGHQPLDEVQRRFSDGDVEAWHARVDRLRPTATARIGAAAHSVRAVPADALSALAGAAGTRPVHVHLSEQPAENAAVRAVHGCTPTRLLADAGLLGPRTTAVHATHLTDADVALLGTTGTAACFCPTTERDLADGIGPARRLHEAGSPLTLGSDSQAVVDPFEELCGLEAHERLASGERGRFSPAELVTAASAAGYASLGWDGGRLAVGAPADLVVVRTDSVRTTGARPDQVPYAATAADVDRVLVGGRTVVRDGHHVLGDPARLLREALDRLEEA
ncbi:formimidoylglutamate deiminase [Microlunatus flavus]|uniref:Formiminoglutamate deiminase n=1 Tax=Microlunatus flavus TaxID=1036181 RepID=A0A1H9N8V5_9ACTN|nr:formimidoylglutamate deiminase [Microlunatus flavus]SER32416.1 formiminoglutamate deiminase [Microlunatus flavus]